MDSPFISIITPVFETGELLRETWKSLKNQTFGRFEWILVDDGSDSYTRSIICDIENEGDGLVHAIYLKNSGACYARNRGFERSKGSYVKFLDADDLLESHVLEYQAGKAQENVAQIIAGPTKQVSRDCEGKLKEISYRGLDSGIPSNLFEAHLMKPIVHHSALLLSREIVMQVGGYDESLAADQDGDFVQRLFWVCPRLEYVGGRDSCLLFRQHDVTVRISSTVNAEKFNSRYRVYLKLLALVEESGQLERYRKPLAAKLYRISSWSYVYDKQLAEDCFVEALALDEKLRFHTSMPVHYGIKFLGFKMSSLVLLNIRKIRAFIDNSKLSLPKRENGANRDDLS